MIEHVSHFACEFRFGKMDPLSREIHHIENEIKQGMNSLLFQPMTAQTKAQATDEIKRILQGMHYSGRIRDYLVGPATPSSPHHIDLFIKPARSVQNFTITVTLA